MGKLCVTLLLPLLCVVSLLAGSVSLHPLSEDTVPPLISETASSALSTPTDAYPTALSVSDILERDGYLEGIWFPWLTHDDLGHGFTANETMVEYVNDNWATVGIDQYSDNYLLEQIYNLKALGFNIMGYEGSIYAEGVIFDKNGDVVGIKQDYLDNTRRFLDLCREAQMPVLWTVCCHSVSAVSYYNLEVWYRMTQMYAVKEVADHYAERFVKPLCAVLAEYPDVVVMTAASSELENEMNDADMGNFFDNRETFGVTRESMLYFINTVASTLAECLPNVDRTLCGSTNNMTMYAETDLTFLGHQEYNSAGNADDIASFRSPLPMIVSEFGLGDSMYPSEQELVDKQIAFRNNFRAKGWQGWMMWCWSSNSSDNAYDLIKKGGGITDFRLVAYELHDYIEEYRAARRGQTLAVNTPTMFFNKGDGTVEWMKPTQSHTYKLERSVNGGAWTTLTTSGASVDALGRKYIYQDKTLPASGTVQYRVTVTAAGQSVTAVSNTIAVVAPAVNLVMNGGFESALYGWYLFGSDGTYQMTLNAARTGRYSLELDYGSVEWQGVNQIGIVGKPNTNYALTYYYKYAADDAAKVCYCFVRGGEGTIYDEVIASAYMHLGNKNDWTRETINFRTDSSGKMGIDFRVVIGTHVYIDDVELYEVQ